MTISQTLKFATDKLSAKKIKLPLLEAEILLSSILKKPREFLLTHPEYNLTAEQVSRSKFQISCRLKGAPIAYLTGHKEFYGLNFKVNKNVLIPRPETELMVNEALKLIMRDPLPMTLLDIGTGSGCIIISLIKNIISKFPSPADVSNFEFLATDISKSTLSIAKQNAKLHGLNKIKFIHADLLSPSVKSKIENLRQRRPARRQAGISAQGGPASGWRDKLWRRKSKIFLANLPYGWKAWKNNCSLDTIGLKFEPEQALFTGENGLELYKKLFRQIKNLAIQPAACHILCEFDPRQTAKIKQLIKQELPWAECQIKKDLAGLNRLAIVRYCRRMPHSAAVPSPLPLNNHNQ